MYKGWGIIRGIAAAVGFVLLLVGVGTSDFYVLELGETEPGSAWTTIIIGFLLMMPSIIHAAYNEYKYWQ